MIVDTETQPIPERFDHLYKLISSERFLKKQGLGNEVPFFNGVKANYPKFGKALKQISGLS